MCERETHAINMYVYMTIRVTKKICTTAWRSFYFWVFCDASFSLSVVITAFFSFAGVLPELFLKNDSILFIHEIQDGSFSMTKWAPPVSSHPSVHYLIFYPGTAVAKGDKSPFLIFWNLVIFSNSYLSQISYYGNNPMANKPQILVAQNQFYKSWTNGLTTA